MKDAGDKRPSRHGGHGAPTSPGEHQEGLGFEACRWQSPTPAQTPARAFLQLWGNGRVGARPCSVPAPGAWPTALATACTLHPPCPARLPCPPLGSSLSARLPVWGLSACTSRPGLGFSEGQGAPAACHLRPLPLGWTHCLPIKPPPQEPGPHPLLGADIRWRGRGGGCSCTCNSGCDGLGRGVGRAVDFCYGGVAGAGVTVGLR